MMKQRVARNLLVGTSFFLLVGCGDSSPTVSDVSPSVAVSAEEKLYENHCLNCHGAKLQGGYAPGLKKIGRKYSEEELKKIIVEGIGKMPAQNYIPVEDQNQLAKWLAGQK